MATIRKKISRTVRNLKSKAVDKGEDTMATIAKTLKKKTKPLVKDAKKLAAGL